MSASKTLCRSLRPIHRSVNNTTSVTGFRSVTTLPLARPISTKSLRGSKNEEVKARTFFNHSFVQQQQRRAQSSNATPAPPMFTEQNPGRTALYDLHVQHGAKMVPFGGYSMPVQYADLSVSDSHHWTREKASLFDVGHMVQYHVEGPGAEAFLESLTPSGLRELRAGHSTLSALLHPQTGGIADDCIITRLEEGPGHLFYLVTNAGCREKDYAYLSRAIDAWTAASHPPVHLRHLESDGQPYGLIALQGPGAASILAAALSPTSPIDFTTWYFGQQKLLTLTLPSGAASHPIIASRGGYTGEDGFELSLHPTQTHALTQRLLDVAGPESLRLAGLAARDSLRLEAGMCLYGHDLDDTTTPVEAGLAWIVPKARRAGARANFPGADTVVAQLTPKKDGGVGVARRRVGLVVEGAPAREGADVVDATSGAVVGSVTSGCPSPTLKKNIAMAYVQDGMHKAGTEVRVVVRGKARKAVVTKMPFVPSKYVKAA